MIRHNNVLLAGMLLVMLLAAGCASSPQNSNQAAAARANTKLAADFLRHGHLDNAEKYFHKALAYDSDRVDALWGLAVTYNRLGQVQKAASYYEQAMSNASRPDLTNSYAAFLCLHGNKDKAISLFEQAAKHPGYGRPGIPLANAGLCLKKNGQTEQAIEYFKQALARNRNQPLALTQMAHIALRHGNASRAGMYISRVEQNGELSQNQLKLAARIALASGNQQAARQYVARYNKNSQKQPISISQLRSAGA